jgi:hypothetical protein
MGDLQSIDELKNLEQRFAKLESENASLCAEIAELRPKPAAAPKPPIEQQTVVTYPTPFASVVMPSNEQLIALANIVVGIHPELSGRMGLHRATDEEDCRDGGGVAPALPFKPVRLEEAVRSVDYSRLREERIVEAPDPFTLQKRLTQSTKISRTSSPRNRSGTSLRISSAPAGRPDRPCRRRGLHASGAWRRWRRRAHNCRVARVLASQRTSASRISSASASAVFAASTPRAR